jgi:hypothetical protein
MVDAILKNELAMFDKGMYPTVAPKELLPVVWVGGFSVHNTAENSVG